MMAMNAALTYLSTALALTLLLGQVTDRTTGQPLRGVHVQLRNGRTMLRAVTNGDGQFRLAGVRPGARTLRYWSADVPPENFPITVRGTRQNVNITACSTTLDYSCADGGGS